MAKFTYNGSDERVFPSISVVVEPGDIFDAPDDFSAFNITSVKTTQASKTPEPATPTVGE